MARPARPIAAIRSILYSLRHSQAACKLLKRQPAQRPPSGRSLSARARARLGAGVHQGRPRSAERQYVQEPGLW